MFKAKGSLAIVVLFLFVSSMGSCGGGIAAYAVCLLKRIE